MKTFNEWHKEKELEDTTVVYTNDSYEKQWADAIDQALADAALEAFKESIRNNIWSVLEKPHPSDADLNWLQRRIETKIDVFNKIIHLSKTEGVTHESECSEGTNERREDAED